MIAVPRTRGVSIQADTAIDTFAQKLFNRSACQSLQALYMVTEAFVTNYTQSGEDLLHH